MGGFRGIAALAAVLLLVVAGSAAGAGGDLDPTFDTDGLVEAGVLQSGASSSPPADVLVDAGGKIVALATSNGRGDWTVLRVKADGSRDTGFGTNGVAAIDAVPRSGWCCGQSAGTGRVLIEHEGKLLAGGGFSTSDGPTLAIARLNGDGSLDTSFSGDGLAFDPGESSSFFQVKGLGVTADGTIVAAGDNSTPLKVARFSSAGRYVDGTEIYGPDSASFSFTGMDLRSDGSITLVARYTKFDWSTSAWVTGLVSLRLNPDLTQDTSFGSSGFAWTPLPNVGWAATSFAADGSSVTVGSKDDDLVAVRLLADGSRDSGFGGGLATTDVNGTGSVDRARAVALDGSKVVVAGESDGAFVLARYRADGTLDPAFGSGGIVKTTLSDPAAWIGAVAIDSSGRYVAAGTASGLTLARYLGAGAAPVNGQPTASFTVSPSSGTTSTSFAFDGRASSDPDADPLTYAWTFGDGAAATGSTSTHTYALPGTYTATLTVNDGHGHTDATTRSIPVSPVAAPPGAGGSGAGGSGGGAPTPSPNRPPVAGFEIEPTAPNVGSAVTFDASGSSDPDGDELTLTWAFGDGDVAAGRRVTHVFSAAGTYDVRLTVSDGRGGSSSASRSVLVSPARRVGLAMSRIGAGVGTVSGGGLACGRRCTGTYVQGTSVVLQAVPATGHVFKGWGGGCSGAGSTCTLTVGAAQVVTARFEPRKAADPYTLVVLPRPDGAVATWEWGIDGAPVDCGPVCVNQFRRNSFVRLIAVPRVGFDFAGWTGACAGQGSWCRLEMSLPRTTSARFVPQPAILSVTTAGAGTVATWDWALDGRPIDCGSICAKEFRQRAHVWVVAVPAPGFDFAGWTGACAGQGPWCELTMTGPQRTHVIFVTGPGASA